MIDHLSYPEGNCGERASCSITDQADQLILGGMESENCPEFDDIARDVATAGNCASVSGFSVETTFSHEGITINPSISMRTRTQPVQLAMQTGEPINPVSGSIKFTYAFKKLTSVLSLSSGNNPSLILSLPVTRGVVTTGTLDLSKTLDSSICLNGIFPKFTANGRLIVGNFGQQKAIQVDGSYRLPKKNFIGSSLSYNLTEKQYYFNVATLSPFLRNLQLGTQLVLVNGSEKVNVDLSLNHSFANGTVGCGVNYDVTKLNSTFRWGFSRVGRVNTIRASINSDGVLTSIYYQEFPIQKISALISVQADLINSMYGFGFRLNL